MKNRASFPTLLYVLFFSILILLITNSSKAQINTDDNRQKGNFTSRLFFGGGCGLQFGSVTLIELSPLVGYKVTPKFSLGVSPTYKYYKYNDYYGPSNDLSTNVWGGSIFARYSIFQNVFAHVEYETLYYNTKVSGNPEYMQQYNSFFVGGGYNQQIGQNSAMYFLLLWNLNDTPDSPYINPVIRIGFSVGM
jgi:hypothetical protein